MQQIQFLSSIPLFEVMIFLPPGPATAAPLSTASSCGTTASSSSVINSTYYGRLISGDSMLMLHSTVSGLELRESHCFLSFICFFRFSTHKKIRIYNYTKTTCLIIQRRHNYERTDRGKFLYISIHLPKVSTSYFQLLMQIWLIRRNRYLMTELPPFIGVIRTGLMLASITPGGTADDAPKGEAVPGNGR